MQGQGVKTVDRLLDGTNLDPYFRLAMRYHLLSVAMECCKIFGPEYHVSDKEVPEIEID